MVRDIHQVLMVKVAFLSSIEMPELQEEEKKNEELLEAGRSCHVATVTGLPISVAVKLWPLPAWTEARPEDVGLEPAQLEKVRDYVLTGDGAGYIIRCGRLAMSWGGTPQRYDLKSTTKSISVTTLGLAVADGKIGLVDKCYQASSGIGGPTGA